MGLSDGLTGILNFVTLLLSIPIIAAGVWLAKKHSTDCYRFLQWPVIVLGVFILLVSLAGFAGSCCRITFLLWIYLAVMFILILLLFIFTIFAFVVTNKGAGEVVSNKGFKEYRLGDYSTWLQRQVNKNSNWRKIRSCLSDAKVCDSLNDEYLTEDAFNNASLSPVQSGCCKPPQNCGCKFENATIWESCLYPGSDSDCTTYQPDPSDLCYSCNSCRAGVLQNIKNDWRKVAIINIVFLTFLVICYSVGCCAFRNVRRAHYHSGPYAYK